MPDGEYIRIQLGGHKAAGSEGKPTILGWALVDVADAHLATHRWTLKDGCYALRFIARGDGTYRQERMSRRILGLGDGDPRQADHVNGDTLDNRRANLRIVTNAQNAQNMAAHSDARSAYRGVDWFAPHGKWRARAHIGGRSHHIGYFDDEAEAGDAARVFREAHMSHNVEARHLVQQPDA